MSEATQPVEAKSKSFKTAWIIGLVLLAIVGIAAVVGNAVYGDFVHRAQVSEAITILTVARTGLALDFQENKKWPENLNMLGDNNTSGKYTESVRITRGAGGTGEVELTATMRTTGVDRRVAGKTILFVSSDGGMNWTCKPGTMPAQHLPGNCR